MSTPIIAVTGWAGCGKTEFLLHLLPELRRRGLKTAVIWREKLPTPLCAEAQQMAAETELFALSCDKKSALFTDVPLTAEELQRFSGTVDLILQAEEENLSLPRVEIHPSGFGPLQAKEENRIALISDNPISPYVPWFCPADAVGVADCIVEYTGLNTSFQPEYRAIRRGEAEDLPFSDVHLTVNGEEVPLVPFVREMLKEVNLGALRTLKDIHLEDGRKDIQIRFSVEKEEKR